MKALVLDDDPATVDLLRLALESFGHTVTTASTADEALSLVRADPPHVILADLRLSDTADAAADGCSFARAVRADPALAGVAMLAVTGATSAAELTAARASGFDECLVKPSDVRELLELVTRLADGRSASRTRSADGPVGS